MREHEVLWIAALIMLMCYFLSGISYGEGTMPKAKERFDGKTVIAMVLDETGSMQERKKQTVSAYNEYVKSIGKEKNVKFVLTRFNSEGIRTEDMVDASEAKTLNDETYQPRANTPLWDAIGKTIQRVEDKINYSEARYRVLFVVLTDGEENSSTEFKSEDIRSRIRNLESNKGWTFTYLGSDQDSWANTASLGFRRENVVTFKGVDFGNAIHAYTAATGAYLRSSNVGAAANVMGAQKKAGSDELIINGKKK